ncbi:50S ribosomal protein L6 [Halorarum halophilum]|uniref:Large ribosomal subunit protein uL6 n=1 Tax=Halorarum halophilum TaxID=2743090 RepID=A0A7D5KTC8_9EURY|nr:50S ribosomal protein L6 [Halobaculum halophilum]QLG26140.1 50S ribosomal protein L6 [Halobaculum halophilum]
MARTEIELPEDVSAELDHLDLTVEGPNGSATRRLWYPNVGVSVEDGAVVIEHDDDAGRKTTATVGTFRSHVRNMIHGVTDEWEYKMEVFYAHFPMDVSVEGDDVVITNFLGEKAPRRAAIRGDTDVQIDGEELTLTGPSKEDVGQTAANIEQLTRVTDKDSRVFQDGVYITEKPTGGA